MLRGIAAFVVLFGHWRSLFFVDWPQVHQHNLALEFFYGSAKYGHQAVVVFFVLSGYLIGRTVLRAVWAGKWSAKHYAFHRMIRLELVLLPSLLLCWMWDFTGIQIFRPSPTYMGTGGSMVLLENVSQLLNFRIFAGNAAFLQTLLVPCFGSDQPLWSLANEFWYYVLFPCMVVALTKGFSWKRRVFSAAIMIVVSLFIGKWMLGGFLIWLLGVGLIFLPRPNGLRIRHHWLFLVITFLLVIIQLVLTFDPRNIERGINTDYVLGVVVAIFVYALLHHPQSVGRLYSGIAKQIAGFSYTLYLTHMPILVFFSAWMKHRSLPTMKGSLLPLAILCVTIAYAYVIAMIFERNTDKIRTSLESRFGL